MQHEYVAPSFKENGFNCPHCGIWAHQTWFDQVEVSNELAVLRSERAQPLSPRQVFGPAEELVRFRVKDMHMSRCERCNQHALWKETKMVFPVVCTAPMPSADMPEEVKADL
jgi:predicted RNA-binding Zn-ribbon protein involved in translation (DUF1610 family)